MIDMEQVKRDIDVFLQTKQIEQVPRGAMKRPELAHELPWTHEDRRHSFTISKKRDLYRPPVNDDGEPDV
jgi:hypothetical protein